MLTVAEQTDQFLAYLARRGVRLERTARGKLIPVAVGGIPLTPALRAEIARRREQLLPFATPREGSPVTTTETKLTFAELAEMEPGLLRLEADIRRTAYALRRKRRRCRNGIWFGYGRYPYYGYKRRLTALIGHVRDAGHPDPAADAVLRSSRAYDVAYRHLYELVPECRTCSCW